MERRKDGRRSLMSNSRKKSYERIVRLWVPGVDGFEWRMNEIEESGGIPMIEKVRSLPLVGVTGLANLIMNFYQCRDRQRSRIVRYRSETGVQ